MRKIDVNDIKQTIENLFIAANFDLPNDVLEAVKQARETESSLTAKEILGQILKNADIAHQEELPLCQDCGVALVFMDIGQDVFFTGGDLRLAINEGVRSAYTSAYLRKSIVKSPIDRKNTGDNTPAIIYFDIVPGDTVSITVLPKGGGCENMSALAMLNPSDGINGVKRFVLETVYKGGANPCPPTIVGVGLGGSFDYAAFLAKKALLRPVGTPNDDPKLDTLEKELLSGINALGIGPLGMGGKTTAFAVHILESPCHIASLPVAVNMECHSHRHKEATI
ncbi:MAG: fumarate hydratase [Spirochaetales bacterium]|nr:fumarate hydratase [Spirochaetales bacterium]